ncbi:cupin domain-containing protein [Methanomassiliicoccus luminyensis]|jgi:quercetin dioxygenase-like cupin family protein|uniref:cupin domain-containing protein n=1 Tax=Methanomassiliicoccus luminyensis TaxID=1080712 RepID=UPI000360CA87|nr:cupin domain-containing protein [Methanomassiliicoccus luminyensis]
MKHFRASSGEWVEGKGYRKKRLLGQGFLPKNVDLVQEVRFRRGEAVPPHYHKVQTEVFYVLGRGSFVVSGTRLSLEPGDIVVCEPGEVHETPAAEEDFGFLVLKVDYRDDDTVWL